MLVEVPSAAIVSLLWLKTAPELHDYANRHGTNARALAKIVRNAVRYAGASGKITISAKNISDQIKITVADCGAGVPEAELGKLFDPFHRFKFDRARQSGGTGLGLAIVKTCVAACQGKVFARNRIPKGFEVVITLNS